MANSTMTGSRLISPLKPGGGDGTNVTVGGQHQQTWDADTKVNVSLLATDATANTVPLRDGDGQITVKTPTANSHAASKGYVDSLIPDIEVV